MNNNTFLQKYFEETDFILNNIKNNSDEIIKIKNEFQKTSKSKGKVIIAGNGGSAAIASHVSVDLSKNAGIRAINFNDADLITCLSNDYSYEEWIESALKIYVDKKDIVVLVSSSGSSKNHLKAARYLKQRKIRFITLTAKDKNNPLKKINHKGINIWINSKSYNIIEVFHLYILLLVVDLCIGKSAYSPNRKLKY
jgi:D-sedoheptulose 7-phosphate isomerase